MSGLNLTVGTKEKFALHSIDELCSMLDHSFSCGNGSHCKVLGRTYDLKSAYKQFALCESDRRLVRIAVNKPGRKDPVLLGLNSLPFGAVGSVAGFLRLLCGGLELSALAFAGRHILTILHLSQGGAGVQHSLGNHCFV